jgi:excisionase family DNA binding protein
MARHHPLPPKFGPERRDVQQRVQGDGYPRRAQSGISRGKPEPIAPSPSLRQLLTVPEAARILRLSCRTMWRMIDDGRLPAARFGRAVRVHPDAVAALIKQSLEDDGENK